MTAFALAEQILLERLPERIRQLGALPNAADVSVIVDVGKQAYRLTLSRGQVSAIREPETAGSEQSPATFRLSLSETAFEHLLAPVLDAPGAAVLPLHMVNLDAEMLELLANVPGSLEMVVIDEAQSHHIVLGLDRQPAPEVRCTVRCTIMDLRELQAGKAEPLTLLMNGRLTIEGDPQVALALGGLLLG